MGGGAGNDWRVQLADYASSRLKDEEMMRCQADLRAARAEIERLNNVVRQAQSRAADDIRREQVHCAAASFTRWTNPSQMTRAGPAPGPGCAQPLPYVCLPCIPHMDGYAMCMFTRARDPLLRRKSSPAEQGCECVRVSVCDLHACARVGAAGLSPAADRVFGRASAAHPA